MSPEKDMAADQWSMAYITRHGRMNPCLLHQTRIDNRDLVNSPLVLRKLKVRSKILIHVLNINHIQYKDGILPV